MIHSHQFSIFIYLLYSILYLGSLSRYIYTGISITSLTLNCDLHLFFLFFFSFSFLCGLIHSHQFSIFIYLLRSVLYLGSLSWYIYTGISITSLTLNCDLHLFFLFFFSFSFLCGLIHSHQFSIFIYLLYSILYLGSLSRYIYTGISITSLTLNCDLHLFFLFFFSFSFLCGLIHSHQFSIFIYQLRSVLYLGSLSRYIYTGISITSLTLNCDLHLFFLFFFSFSFLCDLIHSH